MRRNEALHSASMCQGTLDPPGSSRSSVQPGSKTGNVSSFSSQTGEHESLLFSEKLWKAVGLEKRLLNCRWSLYHPEFRDQDTEHNSTSMLTKEHGKAHRGYRSRPSRSRMHRTIQEHFGNCEENVEQNHRVAPVPNHQRKSVELGDCAICCHPVNEGDLQSRPALQCQKCHRRLHLDCYSENHHSSPSPHQVVFCPEHEPSASNSRKRCSFTNDSRRVRCRLGDEDESMSEVDEADRFDLCLSSVPKQLRSSLRSSAPACARRKPRSLKRIEPELKLSMQWPSLIDSDRELTWGCCSKPALAQTYVSTQETGSNQSSPTHADCTPDNRSHAASVPVAARTSERGELPASSHDSESSEVGEVRNTEVFSRNESAHKQLQTTLAQVCSTHCYVQGLAC